MKQIERKKVITLLFIFFYFIQFNPVVSCIQQNGLTIPTNDGACEHSLLIIIPKRYDTMILQQFKNYKNEIYGKTEIITTKEIFNTYPGRDKQEQIKYCIKQAYDEFHISSVLIIGDYKDIPVRYCYNNDGFLSYPEPYFISDLYYADLYDGTGCFSSWDTDNDGIFGEWQDESADDADISLTPEVTLGRLPCSNIFEVKTVIRKIIDYEINTAYSNWFHRFVVAGGDTYSEARGYVGEIYDYYEGEVLTSEAVDIMSGFNATKLFASTETLSTLTLIKAINQGCGFLYLSGHGSSGVWNTHPPNSAETVGNFQNMLMPLLRNKNKLPVCIVEACHNSQFDVSPLRIFCNPYIYGTWHRDCWSWKLTSLPHGGSIATIGCTGLSWQ
ncbi:MAG: hypothetical protein DRN27_09380, partial [Thermoplasmata archaeon]